jgi:hypothetical protein
MLAYYWSEAAFGPSQPHGGPLRMAIGFTLISGALACFALALLRFRARVVDDEDRIARVGTLLGYLAIGLLAIGTVLWWPILFVWPDYGPLAGAPVGLGVLSLLAMWLLVGLRAARDRAFPDWARPLPLSLLGVFCLIFYVTGTASAWPVVVGVVGVFNLGWVLMAYVSFRRVPLEVASVATGGRPRARTVDLLRVKETL